MRYFDENSDHFDIKTLLLSWYIQKWAKFFRVFYNNLLFAVTKRGYKLSPEVLSNVCWWKSTPSSSRRFLWHCTPQVLLLLPCSFSYAIRVHMHILSNIKKKRFLCIPQYVLNDISKHLPIILEDVWQSRCDAFFFFWFVFKRSSWLVYPLSLFSWFHTLKMSWIHFIQLPWLLFS